MGESFQDNGASSITGSLMDQPDINITTHSIPVGYSRLLARTLGLLEKDLDQLLFRTGLEGRKLLSDDTMLTGNQQLQILSNSLDIARDETFGLQFGETLTPSTHGPLGFLVNSSPTLIKALARSKITCRCGWILPT